MIKKTVGNKLNMAVWGEGLTHLIAMRPPGNLQVAVKNHFGS